MTQPLITVIGSLNADLITRTSRIPSAGETLTAQSFDTGFGGKGANQATACARLSRRYDSVEKGELRVKIVGMVGDDAFGRDIRWPMVSNGIDITDVWVKEGYKTGVAIIIVEEGTGENRILLSPNANYAFKHTLFTTIPGPIPDLILLQLEIPMETVLKILELAQEKKIQVIFNPAPAQALPKEAYKALRHLIVNETEAAILSEGAMLSRNAQYGSSQLSDIPPLPDASTSLMSTSSSLLGKARSSDMGARSEAGGLSKPGRESNGARGPKTVGSSATSVPSFSMPGSFMDAPMSTETPRLHQPQSSGSSSYSVPTSTKSSTAADSRPDLSTFVETAGIFHHLGTPIVVITLGSQGVFVSIASTYFYFPAEKVDVVDTTAAGDTFVGAYAVAIAKYRTKEYSTLQILSAIKWANRCASRAVTKKGAQSAIPWLNEVVPFELDISLGEANWDQDRIKRKSSGSLTPSLTTTSSISDSTASIGP